MHKKRWILSATVLCLGTIAADGTQAQKADVGAPGSASVSGPNETGSKGSDEHGQLPVLQHRNHRYQLHSADVLELSFPFTPEFNQTVTVQPDGYITLRGVDSVHVQGQTLPQATESLRALYGKILHDPVINVELKDFEKPYFIVGGEVGHPGKFDLRGETTAAEAIAIAGGLKDSAKHSEILLFRRVPDGWVQSTKINMKKMLHEANLDEDAHLEAGDFLYVPKNTLSKIERFIPPFPIAMSASPITH